MIITLSGPTCAGKSEVEKSLVALGLRRAISHTTRTPRPGERNGVDYHFVSLGEFWRMERLGQLVETNQFADNMYGKSVHELSAQGSCVAVIEPTGARNVAEYCCDHEIPLLQVWIECSPEAQAMRWLSRIGESFAPPITHASRLAAMLGVEREWRDKMRGLASLHLDSTNASPSEIAACILNYVRSLTPGAVRATMDA